MQKLSLTQLIIQTNIKVLLKYQKKSKNQTFKIKRKIVAFTSDLELDILARSFSFGFQGQIFNRATVQYISLKKIMNQSAKSWLLLMMIPFFVGVIVYFVVPLQMIVGSNPKLEGTFNNYKIEVEQNTVRALAFLNSRVVTNRLQMYRNILSTVKKLLAQTELPKVFPLDQVSLNSAFQIANAPANETFPMNTSMWYSPNASNPSSFNQAQHSIMDAYRQVQPFIKSVFSGDLIYSPIDNLKTIISYEDQQFFFRSPSQNRSEFAKNDTSVLNYYYLKTIQNYEESGLNMTVYDQFKLVRICTIIFFKQYDISNGVTCMDIQIGVLMNDITTVLNTTTSELSTDDYFYVRPLYKFENLRNPQIQANFSSNNFSNVNIPKSDYFELDKNSLSPSIFGGQRYYYYNVQRLGESRTYYTIPIATANVNGLQEIVLYLVVLNNFAKAEFAEQSRSERIAVVMAVPAVVLLFISILVTTLVLRSIFRKLDEALKMMENFCSLIKRGDLQLEIPEYTEAEDLSELFRELGRLNELNKYSDYDYFDVPKPERVVRLLKCMRLFEQLGYDLTGIQQNLCECYVEIGDFEKALYFLRLSIDKTIKQIYGRPEQIQKAYEQKVNRTRKPDKAMKKKEKVLTRKILRLCQIIFSTLNGKDTEAEDQITRNAELVRLISYPEVLNFEYIGCLMFIANFTIRYGQFAALEDQLDTLRELLRGYEEVSRATQCPTPPEVMLSYWYSIKANVYMAQKRYLDAYANAVESLRGNHFDPRVHSGSNLTIQRILQLHRVNRDELKKFKYLKQYRPRSKREYIFLVDVSKPGMDAREVSIWKREARAAAEYILENHVEDSDRVSITEFCLDIKVVCNLVEKGNRDKMLRKELLAAMKAREQSIVANVLPCLRKCVERVGHLKNEKVFLLFLKDGAQLSETDLMAEFAELSNYQVLIFLENRNLLTDRIHQAMDLSYSNLEDVGRILGRKTIKYADNIVCIF